jgi:hypothetical protein
MTADMNQKQNQDVAMVEQLPDAKEAQVGKAAPKSKEEKALVRKIDLYLMPTIWILYLLAVSNRWTISKRRSLPCRSTWIARILATPRLQAWKKRSICRTRNIHLLSISFKSATLCSVCLQT